MRETISAFEFWPTLIAFLYGRWYGYIIADESCTQAKSLTENITPLILFMQNHSKMTFFLLMLLFSSIFGYLMLAVVSEIYKNFFR